MEKYRKEEDNKYYLKQLNSKTGEFEWIEIDTTSIEDEE
jgi:hypothetical protein